MQKDLEPHLQMIVTKWQIINLVINVK